MELPRPRERLRAVKVIGQNIQGMCWIKGVPPLGDAAQCFLCNLPLHKFVVQPGRSDSETA